MLSVGHIIESLLEIVGVSLFVPLLMLAGGGDLFGQGELSAKIARAFELSGMPMTIQNVLLFLIITFTAKALFQVGLRFYSCELTSKHILDISNISINKLERASEDFLKGRSRGDLSNILTEQLKRSSLIILWTLMGIAALVSVFAYIIFSLVVSYKIVFVLAPILVVVSVGAHYFMRYSRRYGIQHSDLSQSHVRVILEFLENIKTAKSFGRSSMLGNRTLPSIALVARNWRQLQFLSSSLVAAFQPLMAIALAVGFYILSLLKVPLAEIIVCLISFQKIYPALTSLQMLRTNIELYAPSIFEVEALLDGLERSSSPRGGKHISGFSDSIVFNNVSFGFGDHKILNGVDFEIKKGLVTAIVGRSGEGKSTIVDLLAQFIHPQSGEITVDSVSLRDIDSEVWRSGIAIVPQAGVFLNDTIQQNISYLEEHTNLQQVRVAIDAAEASQFINALDGGDLYKLNDSASNLSGGQKQRILIARALYSDRDFYIFDEPTSALDFETEERILLMLEKLKSQAKTVVLITHNQSLLSVANVVYYVANGKLESKVEVRNV